MNKQKNIIRLKGEIIDLCIVRTDDEAIHKYITWMSDEEILMYIGRNTKIVTYTEEDEWAKSENRNNSTFNIVTKDGALIGNCDIIQINNSRNYSLGICIGEKDARNKGYGTEVIKMLIKFGFEECNAHRIKLTLNGDNLRAKRCYEKAGLKVCGIEHETQWNNGHWSDTIYMEILEKDYYN